MNEKPKTITMAEQDATETFSQGMRQLMAILWPDEALTTDESMVWDFLEHFGPKERCEAHNSQVLAALTKACGREVKAGSLLWEIARDIEALQATPTQH